MVHPDALVVLHTFACGSENEKDRVWNFCSKAPVWSILMLTIIVYSSAQVLNTPFVTVYRFGIYGFCFFAGYFLFSHEEVMERLCKWWWMFDLASAVLGISYTVRYFGEITPLHRF